MATKMRWGQGESGQLPAGQANSGLDTLCCSAECRADEGDPPTRTRSDILPALTAAVPTRRSAAARLFGGVTQDRWADLLFSVQTGEPAFRKQPVVDGPFGGIAADPELAALFDEAMAEWTKHVAVAAVAAYDFARFGTIVDVGGGNGTLLAGILGITPGPRGIVFDLPHVAERARAHLAEVGVADRCTAVAGDFFKEVPRGGDAYLLKHVIHDWNDDCAVQILTTCRRAMGPGARLLII
jgi:hypothetical protein